MRVSSYVDYFRIKTLLNVGNSECYCVFMWSTISLVRYGLPAVTISLVLTVQLDTSFQAV